VTRAADGSIAPEWTLMGLSRAKESKPMPTSAEDLRLVYQELRAAARRMLQREPYAHTLESCELVHQAWERLLDGDLRPLADGDPKKVLPLAVLNMRRELVDHARRRKAGKRPDPRGRVNLEDATLLGERDPDTLLEVDRLLDQLAEGGVKVRNGARKAEIGRYAFYGGFSESEIGELLDLPKSTVGAELRFVKAWLHSQLQSG
jgi:RNA polymerase sigma factor (TIGR02999 family)